MAVPQMPRKWMWRGVVFKRRSMIGIVVVFFPIEKNDFERHDEDAQKKGAEEGEFVH
jgi:hypothetical protein